MGSGLPCQTCDSKRAEMRTVLELAFPRKFGSKEADTAHGRRELIDVVLSEVGTEDQLVRDPCSQRM